VSFCQGGVTLSSSETKYVAASAVAQENTYLRALLSGFNCSPLGPTCVWEDNAACILMGENPVNHDRSSHFDVKFHFLRERVRAGEIKLYKCWGPLNVADALTKACLDLLFISKLPSCTEHALLTGLSPARLSRSSFLCISPVSCTSSPDKFVDDDCFYHHQQTCQETRCRKQGKYRVFNFPFSTIFLSVT